MIGVRLPIKKKNSIDPYAVLAGKCAASIPSCTTASGSSARSSNGVGGGVNSLAQVIGSAFSMAARIFGSNAKKEIAAMNNATDYKIALLPTFNDQYRYSSRGKLLGRSTSFPGRH